jgi:hypothetical protein
MVEAIRHLGWEMSAHPSDSLVCPDCVTGKLGALTKSEQKYVNSQSRFIEQA